MAHSKHGNKQYMHRPQVHNSFSRCVIKKIIIWNDNCKRLPLSLFKIIDTLATFPTLLPNLSTDVAATKVATEQDN